MTCPSSLHFSPVVNLVRPGETHWCCNYCEYTFKSKLYVPAKGTPYCIHSVFPMIRASQLNTMQIADHAGGDEEE
jgi:transposase-like protein